MKYIAYGSNLNLKQMAYRCPTAKVVGTAMLKDWELAFNGVATILPKKGAQVPVGIWELDKACEKALDRYEGYPNMYGKQYLQVECNGQTMECLVYTMNSNVPRMPSISYYRSIQEGYLDVGLDDSFLIHALENTEQRIIEAK